MRANRGWLAASVVILAVLIGSCKKDETTTAPPMGTNLTVAQASFSFHIGDSSSTIISGGTPPYALVDKGDTTKVIPSLSGTRLSVRAIAIGSSAIIVGDSSSPAQRVTINVVVTVPPLIAGQASFNFYTGDSSSSTISGGTPPYALVDKGDTTKVVPSLSGSVLSVRAVAVGSSTIFVGDNSSPALRVRIDVTVSVRPLTANPPSVALTGTTPQNVTISTGTPPYGIAQAPAAGLATAHFVDSTLASPVLVITGVSTATGSTSVIVRDASTPQRTVTVGISKVQ